MPPKHGNQEFYDNTEKCTAETILADLPTSGPFTLIFRSQCVVYLLEDLPACQKVSFFLDFLFVLLLLSQETPPIRGGLDNPACHTHTQTPSLFPPCSPPFSKSGKFTSRKMSFSVKCLCALPSVPPSDFFLQPEPEILIFAREPL